MYEIQSVSLNLNHISVVNAPRLNGTGPDWVFTLKMLGEHEPRYFTYALKSEASQAHRELVHAVGAAASRPV